MNKEELKEKIKKQTLKSETIFIKDWDCEVTVKELIGSDYLELSEKSMSDLKTVDRKMFLIHAIIKSVYKDDELLFDVGDVELVSNLPASIYSELVSSITKLNGITDSKN